MTCPTCRVDTGRDRSANARRGAAAVAIVLIGIASPLAWADEHVVVQKGKAFTTARLVVKSGDTVRFLNLDEVAHNAFSLSSSNPFDTGMATKGAAKDVAFKAPGTVHVECAVHPGMQMVIEVQP